MKKIEEKEKAIKKLELEMEEIKSKMEDNPPNPFFEMNTALIDFIILLLILRVKLIGDTLHLIYIKVPRKWREDMRKAFEGINELAITTPEGLRIHLEI